MSDESVDVAAYGGRLADDYDAIYGGVFDTDGAVDLLFELAAGGRVLEPSVFRSRSLHAQVITGLRGKDTIGSATTVFGLFREKLSQ